jgi:hypothetical protein
MLYVRYAETILKEGILNAENEINVLNLNFNLNVVI